MRVGVISDTHNLLRPQALDALQGSDHIIHGGDIGKDATILEQLRAIAPVTAVRGNNDVGKWAEAIQESETIELAGVRIHVVHDLKTLALDPVKNKIVITPDNQILWNGTAITEGQLVGNLQETRAIQPEPELQYQPDAQASYDLSVKVLNVIKQSGVTKFGFVGNEQFRAFDKAPGA